MQRLDLNLASNPFRNNTLLWVGYGGTAVLLTAFTLWNATTWLDYRGRLAELRDTVGTFATQRLELATRAKRAADGIRRFDVEALDTRAHKANEIIQWKAFSWTRLFNALERVLPNGVRMNSVRPIFNAGTASRSDAENQGDAMPVAIEGTARTFGDLAALQEAFNADPQFGRIEPERLNKADNGEYVFALRCEYLPDAEGAPPAEASEAVASEAATADSSADGPGADAEAVESPPGGAPAAEAGTDAAARAPTTADPDPGQADPSEGHPDRRRVTAERGKAPRGGRRTRPGSQSDGGPR